MIAQAPYSRLGILGSVAGLALAALAVLLAMGTPAGAETPTPPQDLRVVIDPDGTVRLVDPAVESADSPAARPTVPGERSVLPSQSRGVDPAALVRRPPAPEIPPFQPGFETRSGAPLGKQQTIPLEPGEAPPEFVPDPVSEGAVFPQKVPLAGAGPGRRFDPNARATPPSAPEPGSADLSGRRGGERRELINLDAFDPAGGVRLENGDVVLTPARDVTDQP